MNLTEPFLIAPDISEKKSGACAPRTCEGDPADWVTFGQLLVQIQTTKRPKGGQRGDADFERLEALWTKLTADDRAAILALAATLGAKQSL